MRVIKGGVGYLPEDKFPNYLTGRRSSSLFRYAKRTYKTQVKSRSDEYLKIVDMEKWKKTKIKIFQRNDAGDLVLHRQ